MYQQNLKIKMFFMYTVYMLRCSDDTIYTGITNNLEKRIKMHNGYISWGARYTSGRRPVKLVYKENFLGRSEASQREYKIKKMTRHMKEKLINNYVSLISQLIDLHDFWKCS